MRTKHLFKGLLMLTLCMASAAFVSCDSDDSSSSYTANIRDVIGEYNGKMTAGGEEKSVSVKVDDDSVYVGSFPVEEIVKAIVEPDTLDEAIGSLTGTTLTAGYKASVTGSDIAIALYPSPISFQMTVKGEQQTVEVKFAAGANGAYTSHNQSLALIVRASEVSINGVKAEGFEGMDFELKPAQKHNVPDTAVVSGEYEGKMTVNGDELDGTTKASADDDTITVKGFPLKDIVEAVVDEEHLDEALQSVGDTTYAIGYTAQADGSNLKLALSPAKLSFGITAGGQTQTVEVTFSSESGGTYNVAEKKMSVAFKADSVTVDGTGKEGFGGISYGLELVKK